MGAGRWGEEPSVHQLAETLVTEPVGICSSGHCLDRGLPEQLGVPSKVAALYLLFHYTINSLMGNFEIQELWEVLLLG